MKLLSLNSQSAQFASQQMEPLNYRLRNNSIGSSNDNNHPNSDFPELEQHYSQQDEASDQDPLTIWERRMEIDSEIDSRFSLYLSDLFSQPLEDCDVVDNGRDYLPAP